MLTGDLQELPSKVIALFRTSTAAQNNTDRHETPEIGAPASMEVRAPQPVPL